MRHINVHRVVAVQFVTPAENPLVTDESRMMDVWFGGEVVRKQMFKKVSKKEQEELAATLERRAFVRGGNLLVDPAAVFFAEMENDFIGGIVTIGYGENGKPVELKLSGKDFAAVVGALGAP